MRKEYILAHLRLAVLELQDTRTIVSSERPERNKIIDALRMTMRDVESVVEN